LLDAITLLAENPRKYQHKRNMADISVANSMDQ